MGLVGYVRKWVVGVGHVGRISRKLWGGLYERRFLDWAVNDVLPVERFLTVGVAGR